MIRRYISLGVALTTSLNIAACDSTVWLDDTLPSLTAVYASGACKVTENEIDISVVLVNQGDSTSSNILPTTRVAKEGATPVAELIDSGSFIFNPPPIMEAKVEQGILEGGNAYGESETGLMNGKKPGTVELSPKNVDFQWSSSDPEAGRIPLLILLMDQSNSVLGLSRSEQRFGSDIGHQRITFFKSLIKNLNDNFEVAMLTFSGFTSDYGSDSSVVNVPTVNRELVGSALEELKFSNKYEARTPLSQALNDAKSLIESQVPDTYDPVVVVFTDGLEDGDNSMGGPSIDELATFFVQRHVPVHTIQLRAKQDTNPASGDLDAESKRPKPLEKMSALACQTGGDFYYIRNAEDFTSNNDLGPMLRNRLTGRWSLKVNTNMFDPDKDMIITKDGKKDNCPNTHNVNQADSDGNGIGDACEIDFDNDDKNNDVDNCPLIENADQMDTDEDGIGDVCDDNADDDEDGIDDGIDNCPGVQNPNQLDFDSDRIGDACDDDDDNDEVPDAIDDCPFKSNPDGEPCDASGIMLTTSLEATLAGEVERFNAAQTIESITSTVKTDNRIWILNPAQ